MPSGTRPSGTAQANAVYRLTADQFQRMARAGILSESDHVELLGGLIFTKRTRNPPHNFASGQLHELLLRAMVAGWCVEKETPLRLSRLWQPEPDVMILRGGRQDYRGRLPGPGDVALVVEVSDESSQARDRGRKLRGYARAGIPVYWLVELVARRVEVHTGPTGPCPTPCFRHTVPFGPNEELPAVIDGREVLRFVVRDILP